MKNITTILIMLALIVALAAGCQNSAETIIEIGKHAKIDVEFLYQRELTKCNDPNDCPRAERLAEYSYYLDRLELWLTVATQDELQGGSALIDCIIQELEPYAGDDEYAVLLLSARHMKLALSRLIE